MTLVAISSDLYGVSFGVVRLATDREVLVAMTYRPPAGTPLGVHFRHIYHHEAFGEVCDGLSVRCVVSERTGSGGGIYQPPSVWLRIVELVADPPDNVSHLRMQ